MLKVPTKMTDSVDNQTNLRSVAIQGELGSNSHMAAREMLGEEVEIAPCATSADVFHAILEKQVDAAVLPIENSLHGSVFEHYDLLFEHPVRIDRESLLRIHHNLIVASGVSLNDVRRVISHPVALSQCRRYLSSLSGVRVEPFYDTAGSVKHVMQEALRDVAGVAPALAAQVYGGEVLVPHIEDHTENYTRFYLLRRADSGRADAGVTPNKVSVAFAIEHRPGTLVASLQKLADAQVDLTRIESRPVPGKPWEYVFYVDFRFDGVQKADAALKALQESCSMVKELGRYAAA